MTKMARTNPYDYTRRDRQSKREALRSDTLYAMQTSYSVTPGRTATHTESGNPSLLDLPDELLLLVVSKLLAIRLDQPQSQAFKDRHEEINRQFENYYRRTALYALCLTSRRLNRLAVPALYNAVVGSTTNYGVIPLRLMWTTLTEKHELRYHVQYIENLLQDCLGNSLSWDAGSCDAENMVNEYFEKLVWIIHMCPNIQQMSVISVESDRFTLWYKLLELPRDSLLKLEKLALQTNVIEESSWEDTNFSFNYVLLGLLQCSSLTELRASGVSGGGSYRTLQTSTFHNLQRIEFTECSLSLQDVNSILSTCDNLHHFICHWSFLWCSLSYEQVNLLPGLSKQKGTLETLYLIASRAGFDSTTQAYVSCPSLSQMSTLKEAILCNLFIPDKHCRMPAHSVGAPEVPMAPELPPSLERLTISYTMQYSDPDIWRVAVCKALQQLAADSTSYLPRLRDLVIHYEDGRAGLYSGPNEDLADVFKKKGICLSVVEELDVFATLE